MEISNEKRQEVVETLRYLEDGNRVRYKEEFFELLDEAVMDPCIGYHEMNDVFGRIADLIEPQPLDGSGTAQKQRDAIVTLKTLNSFQAVSCTEAVNVMEAAFGVDGIHELLAKLISVLEGGEL